MLYVVLSNGVVEELDATNTMVLDGALCCRDTDGKIVKQYGREAVAMFGFDETKMKELAAQFRETLEPGDEASGLDSTRGLVRARG